MTRKDYVLLAAALLQACPVISVPNIWDQYVRDCTAIADALSADNQRGFDRELFLRNCGVLS